MSAQLVLLNKLLYNLQLLRRKVKVKTHKIYQVKYMNDNYLFIPSNSHRETWQLTSMRENRFYPLILSQNDENQPWKTNNSY